MQLLEGERTVSPALRKDDGTFEFWRVNPGKYRLQTLRSNCSGAKAWATVEIADTSVEGVEAPNPPPIEPGKPCIPAYLP